VKLGDDRSIAADLVFGQMVVIPLFGSDKLALETVPKL